MDDELSRYFEAVKKDCRLALARSHAAKILSESILSLMIANGSIKTEVISEVIDQLLLEYQGKIGSDVELKLYGQLLQTELHSSLDRLKALSALCLKQANTSQDNV